MSTRAPFDFRRARAAYELSMGEYGVPAHLRDGLIDHVISGHQTGGFLFQCLSNNLTGAVVRAGQDIDIAGLRALAKWLFNVAPAPSWGSEDAVAAWKAKGGEAGR